MATQIQANATKQGPNEVTGTDVDAGTKRAMDVYVKGGSLGGASTEYETRLDEPSSTTTYVGKAAIDSDPAGSVWQIKRILISGTETIIEWADGDSSFDKVWDDRASLSYS